MMPGGDISRGTLTVEQVAAYTDALTRHYGERVAPVSSVCRAIGDYVAALVENESNGPFHADVGAAIRKHGQHILTFAVKSNLLGRLIYDGEPLRTEKCPLHKGVWSGCPFPGGECPHGCTTGGNTTGWLPLTPVSEGS